MEHWKHATDPSTHTKKKPKKETRRATALEQEGVVIESSKEMKKKKKKKKHKEEREERLWIRSFSREEVLIILFTVLFSSHGHSV